LIASACAAPSASPSLGSLAAGTPEEPASTTMEVVCDHDATRVDPVRVMPAEGGVEVTFDNPAGADEYWVRAASSADDWNHGGRVPERFTEWSDPPGRYLVMCHEKGDHPPYYEPDDRYAEFEVVDPYDLWVEPDAECDDAVFIDEERVEGATSQEDVEEWIRDRFDLHEEERRVGGYPWTLWKADAFALTRGDRTMAGWFAHPDSGGWIVKGTACTG
jgi:hypothetical protein